MEAEAARDPPTTTASSTGWRVPAGVRAGERADPRPAAPGLPADAMRLPGRRTPTGHLVACHGRPGATSTLLAAPSAPSPWTPTTTSMRSSSAGSGGEAYDDVVENGDTTDGSHRFTPPPLTPTRSSGRGSPTTRRAGSASRSTSHRGPAARPARRPGRHHLRPRPPRVAVVVAPWSRCTSSAPRPRCSSPAASTTGTTTATPMCRCRAPTSLPSGTAGLRGGLDTAAARPPARRHQPAALPRAGPRQRRRPRRRLPDRDPPTALHQRLGQRHRWQRGAAIVVLLFEFYGPRHHRALPQLPAARRGA